MSVASDLANAAGTHRRLFCKVSGIKEIFWQPTNHINAAGRPIEHLGTPGPHSVLPESIGMWRMDETEDAANAVDESRYSNPMVAVNAPPVGVGKFGNARRGQSGKHFSTADQTYYRPKAFTLSLWCKPETGSLNNNALIVGKNLSTTKYSFFLGLNATGSFYAGRLGFDDATEFLPVGGTPASETWAHLVISFDGISRMRYYHDGTKWGDVTASKTIDYDAGTLDCLADVDAPTTTWFQGLVDDVALYPFAVSDDWVVQTYNNSDYKRPGINCLTPPTESSIGLHPTKMDVSQSAMTFELDNIRDPVDTGTYFFAKKFAPGAFSVASNNRTFLKRHAATASQLDADATTIVVNSNDSWPDSGEGNIGSETFSYDGKTNGITVDGQTVDRFDTVVKGLYPAVGFDNRGSTFLYEDLETDNLNNDQIGNIIVSDKPYTWFGREIGLYITTWDKFNNRWNIEAQAELLWYGTISDSITFDPKANSWQLSCESIFERLEMEVADKLPVAHLNRINMMTPSDGLRTIYCIVTTDGGSKWTCKITIPQGSYIPNTFVLAFFDELNDGDNWSPTNPLGVGFGADGVNFTNLSSHDTMAFSITNHTDGTIFITFVPENINVQTNYILHALGLTDSQPKESEFNHNEDYERGVTFTFHPASGSPSNYSSHRLTAPNDIASGLHSLHNGLNGYRLYISNIEEFWTDQGDTAGNLAFCKVGDFVVAYDGKTDPSGDEGGYLHLVSVPWHDRRVGENRNVSIKEGFWQRGKPSVKAVYLIDHRSDLDNKLDVGGRGPFENLLYALLSSGVSGYNSTTYDQLPARISQLQVPEDIVDTDSFIAIDKKIRDPWFFYARIFYSIENTSWLDLWMREAKLFGVYLVWKNGKLTARSALEFNPQKRTKTIDKSNRADPEEQPIVSTSSSDIVNSWKLQTDYSYVEKKYLGENIINDRNSIQITKKISKLEIKHPGVNSGGKLISKDAYKVLDRYFRLRQEQSRFAWQRVTVSLAPTLMDLVYVGDLVNYISDTHPHPFGLGTMSVNVIARIIDLKWDYASHTGQATLWVNSIYDTLLKKPWGAAAAIDISQTNGGWNETTDTLTLLPYEFTDASTGNKDGFRFLAGDKVLIVERDNPDPAAAQSWQAVISTYTDATNLMVLTGPITLTGWDPDREHVVVNDDWTTVTAGTNQRDDNAFIADATGFLPGGKEANRYG